MSATHVVSFGVFELDARSGELRRHGLKVRLPDQSFQILKVLLSRPGEVVTREELRNVLWTAQTFVDFEVGLNSAVRKLREALDDSAENPRFVETLPRRGYRFVAPVSMPVEAPLAPVSASPTSAGSTLRLPRLSRAAALVLIALVAIAAGALFQWRAWTARRAAAEPIMSVVVLPFENLTGDAAQDSFAETVSDAVTMHLGQVAGLDVISRMSARQYKNTGKSLKLVAQELTIDGVVSGTVARSGEGVAVTVHLIRAATERDVWAKSYQGDVSHILRLQQRIATDLAVATGRLVPPPSGTATTQIVAPEAYSAYLKGTAALGQQRYEGFRRAVGYFEEAVAIQPDFADAHASLALAQLQFLFGGPVSPHDAMPKAEAAARRAMQLDETLPRPHRVLGQILLLYHWRLTEGDKELARAAELQGPANDEVNAPLSASLRRRGRFAEAIAMAERGRKLDPRSVGAQLAVGSAYRAAGQHDRALRELRQALEMSPTMTRVQHELGLTFLTMGRFTDAISALAIAARPAYGHNTRIEAQLGYAYAAAGRTADARAVLKELDAHGREQYVSSFGIALIHDRLGDPSSALAALRRAYQDHAVEFAMADQYPPFTTIAAEPAFQTIMRHVGRPEAGTAPQPEIR